MKKILVILIILSIAFNLASCDRSYDEQEVATAAKELIINSLFLNEIYWGEGIPYIYNASTANGAYCEANPLFLKNSGFETVEELKNLTQEVFSSSYCDSIFQTAFSSVVDETELQLYARYYQKYYDVECKEPECIMVYSYFESLLPDTVEYLYDTLTVSHSKKETVYVKVMARVTREDGESQLREKTIALIEEENGWRLDSATYLAYNSSQEIYEDLLENKK